MFGEGVLVVGSRPGTTEDVLDAVRVTLPVAVPSASSTGVPGGGG